jgi:hypothetical protein
MMTELEVLLDPAETGTPVILELPPGTALDDAFDAVYSVFRADEETGWIRLVVAGTGLGVVSRERLDRLFGPTRGSVEAPATHADGGELPGYSTRYKLLCFRCRQRDTCGHAVYRIHYDETGPPDCPGGHGTMELAR